MRTVALWLSDDQKYSCTLQKPGGMYYRYHAVLDGESRGGSLTYDTDEQAIEHVQKMLDERAAGLERVK
jgi:hypothetical protein